MSVRKTGSPWTDAGLMNIDQLQEALQLHVTEELRKLRCEYRVGDAVVDCYGHYLHIADIYKADPEWGQAVTEYELRYSDGDRAYKVITADKFSFPK